MSDIFQSILKLVANGEVQISIHGYEELAADDILVQDVMRGLNDALIVEDYPDYHKGACVLVLQRDGENKPLHILWGVPKNKMTPAVLITAYRPDPLRWSDDCLRRK